MLFRLKKSPFRLLIIPLIAAVFVVNIQGVAAYSDTYNKISNGTLSADEWNSVRYDFINTWGPATSTGGIGIGINPQITDFNGLVASSTIKTNNNFLGSIAAGYVTPGIFNSINGSGGNYSFPQALGIGTTDASANRLHIDSGGLSLDGAYFKNVSVDTWCSECINTSQIFGVSINDLGGSINPAVKSYGFYQEGTAWTYGIYTEADKNYFSGNLGLSAVDPTSKLQIYTGLAQSLQDGYSNLRLESSLAGTDNANTSGAQITFAQRWTTSPSQMVRTGAIRGWKSQATGNFGGGVQLLYQPAGNVDMVSGLTLQQDGYVGVGTTNPTKKFEIIDGTDSVKFGKWNTGGYAAIWFNQATPSNTNYGFLGNATETQFNAASTFKFNIADITKMTMNSSGNVGIGTTSPAYKLDVYGTGSFSQPVLVGTPTLSGHAATKSYVDSIIAGTSSVPTVGYWTASSTGIFNANSGNVGIGKSSPSYKLDVLGDINVPTAQSYRVNTNAVITQTGGNVDLGFIGYGFQRYTTGGEISFYASNSEKMRLSATGSLGIGTNNPNTPLQVANLAVASVSGQDALKLTGLLNAGTIGSGPVLRFSDSNGTSNMASIRGYTFGTGATGLAFETGWTANVVRMIIDNSGNVGIGTTTPTSARLVVATSTNNYSIDAGSYRLGGVAMPISATDATSKTYVDSAVSAAQAAFWNLSGSNLYTSSTSWNVGIGTSNPLSNLDIGGANPGTFSISSGGVIDLKLRGGSDYNAIDSQRSDDLHFQINSVTKMLLQGTTGNVGIGTSSPAYKLDVYGTGSFTQPVVVGTPISGNHAVTLSYLQSAIATSSDSALGFWTKSVGKLYPTDTTLNVGVGTNAPGYRFVVDGAVNTARIMTIDDVDTTNRAQLGFGVYTDYATIQAYAIGSSLGVLSLNPLGNNVGIGTTTASTKLNVSGQVTASSFLGTIGAANVSNGSFGSGTGGGNYYFPSNVGIGLASAGQRLVVGDVTSQNTLKINGLTTTDMAPVLSLFRSAAAEWVVAGYGASLLFGANPASYSDANLLASAKLVIDSGGNVGIGTSTLGSYKLKVVGDVGITGTLQTMTGSDFAEEFSVSAPIAAGTVVVMDDLGYKSVKPCSEEYDATVVGIVSDNPSIISGRVDSKHKVVVAMMGVVKVKASTINGKIKKGNLLTSSAINGYAMKADLNKSGTIIGKALENLSGSSGEIKVLVNLQ